MPRKTYRAEEIFGILRDIEIMNGEGKSIGDCCYIGKVLNPLKNQIKSLKWTV